MLTKIMKYDFLAMGRTLLPIYGITLIICALGAIILNTDVLYESSIVGVLIILMIYALFAVVVLTLVFSVQRFNKGLLKNEGYLNFSLPVSTFTHVIAKLMNLTIWSIILGFVLMIGLLLIVFITSFLSGDGLETIFYFIEYLFEDLEFNEFFSFIQYALAIAVSSIAIGSKIFASMSIAHIVKRYKTLAGILFFSLLTVIQTTIGTSIESQFNLIDDFQTIINTQTLLNVIVIAITTYLTWFILDKRLNLE